MGQDIGGLLDAVEQVHVEDEAEDRSVDDDLEGGEGLLAVLEEYLHDGQEDVAEEGVEVGQIGVSLSHRQQGLHLLYKIIPKVEQGFIIVFSKGEEWLSGVRIT